MRARARHGGQVGGLPACELAFVRHIHPFKLRQHVALLDASYVGVPPRHRDEHKVARPRFTLRETMDGQAETYNN